MSILAQLTQKRKAAQLAKQKAAKKVKITKPTKKLSPLAKLKQERTNNKKELEKKKFAEFQKKQILACEKKLAEMEKNMKKNVSEPKVSLLAKLQEERKMKSVSNNKNVVKNVSVLKKQKKVSPLKKLAEERKKKQLLKKDSQQFVTDDELIMEQQQQDFDSENEIIQNTPILQNENLNTSIEDLVTWLLSNPSLMNEVYELSSKITKEIVEKANSDKEHDTDEIAKNIAEEIHEYSSAVAEGVAKSVVNDWCSDVKSLMFKTFAENNLLEDFTEENEMESEDCRSPTPAVARRRTRKAVRE